MNELPRRILCELVARHGKSVIREPRRVEGLLRDYCGTHRREISALVTAMEERVASDLLALRPGQPREALLSRLARRLHDNVAMDEHAARWAVDSWALALGIVSSEELEGLEQSKSNVLPTPSPIATQTKSIAATVARTLSIIVVSAAGDGDYATIGEALSAAAPADASACAARPLWRKPDHQQEN
ncbi:MAG: hypothetical protein WKF84_05975 [Pyrinomonadaceae bacterium]